MPKTARTTSSVLRNLISSFGEDILSTDGSVLFCKICSKAINGKKKYFVDEHVKSAAHMNRVKSSSTKKAQMITQSFTETTKKSEFYIDMCTAFTAANIPFWKLENATFKSFLEKYTQTNIPSESTLRKNYLKDVYDQTIDCIRAATANKKLWMSIDETTDIGGRYVANAIVDVLSNNKEESDIFLLNCEFLDKTNSTTIARFFEDSLRLLSQNFNRDDVLLFVTDAAPYMKKAATGIRVLFPKMLHITCVIHGLHRVAEYIREIFPQVDSFVGNLKKIFLKAPARVAIFKNIAPDLTLPPKPVLTRWGTWITSVIYTCKNFEILNIVLESISYDAFSLNKCREIIKTTEFKNDISFITSNYGFLPEIIDKLQTQKLDLHEALKNLEASKSKINEVTGVQGTKIKNKFCKVFENNSGLNIIQNIGDILAGRNGKAVDFTPDEIQCFKYVPLTSCDVERSFSKYKQIVTDKRLNLTETSIKYHIVSSCNSLIS